ncbi:MAG TPA: hypothetical protein VLL77_14160 [Anaerolineales bacterium]|nr:hypothetical protein [Anaerolineales bacterium]
MRPQVQAAAGAEAESQDGRIKPKRMGTGRPIVLLFLLAIAGLLDFLRPAFSKDESPWRANEPAPATTLVDAEAAVTVEVASFGRPPDSARAWIV